MAKNTHSHKKEYTLIYTIAAIFLISLLDSRVFLGLAGLAAVLFSILSLKRLNIFGLVLPVLPFAIFLLVSSLLQMLVEKSFVVEDYILMIIFRMFVAAIVLGTTIQKYSSLYIVEGLENLGLPSKLTWILSLTFRYFHMVGEDFRIGNEALYARGISYRGLASRLGLTGSWIGGFFIKADDHGSRVAAAMASRGYMGGSSRRFTDRPDLYMRLIGASLGIVLILAVERRYIL